MPFAQLNWTCLYYESAGRGAPVVFVHGGFPSLATRHEGFGTWQWAWECDFAARFHFVWYDRRGCWRSQSPSHDYQLENQAQDLARLLDHLHIDAAHVIGSSAGGPIAIAFAALWPERTRSLLLAGTGTWESRRKRSTPYEFSSGVAPRSGEKSWIPGKTSCRRSNVQDSFSSMAASTSVWCSPA